MLLREFIAFFLGALMSFLLFVVWIIPGNSPMDLPMFLWFGLGLLSGFALFLIYVALKIWSIGK